MYKTFFQLSSFAKERKKDEKGENTVSHLPLGEWVPRGRGVKTKETDPVQKKRKVEKKKRGNDTRDES